MFRNIWKLQKFFWLEFGSRERDGLREGDQGPLDDHEYLGRRSRHRGWLASRIELMIAISRLH